MEKAATRGSSKIWGRVFEKEGFSGEELTKAIGEARESFRIIRWWKYGQPAFDIIKGTIDVKTDIAGKTIQDILGTHGQEIQVSLDAFPYGLPNPEGVRINVVFEKNLKQQ